LQAQSPTEKKTRYWETGFLKIKWTTSSDLTFKKRGSQAWWCILIIPALRRLRQEDLEFKASQGYIVRKLLTSEATLYYLIEFSYKVSPLIITFYRLRN
jgi:hypothetical protein